MIQKNESGYIIYESNVGNLEIKYRDNKIIYIQKTSAAKTNDNKEFSRKIITQLDEYFCGKRKEFDIDIELEGTDFQKKVWKALQTIPYGQTRTYKEIAIQVGNEKASRAVGMANNKNSISIIVPCHRVIGSNGKLVGYAGGLDMKSYLLELEKNNK